MLCPLKTLENQSFSGVFSGYKMETLARYGPMIRSYHDQI